MNSGSNLIRIEHLQHGRHEIFLVVEDGGGPVGQFDTLAEAVTYAHAYASGCAATVHTAQIIPLPQKRSA